MCLENPCVAECVAVVEHFLEMRAAEACLVGHLADVSLHVGSTASEDKVQKVMLNASLDEAERTFVIGIYGIIQGDGIKLLFHIQSPYKRLSFYFDPIFPV